MLYAWSSYIIAEYHAQQVENDKFVGTQNSTSRSTREMDGCILLARKMKASTAEGRWNNPV